MAPQNQTTFGTQSAHAWKPEMIFKTFGEPVRRRLLLAIAQLGALAPSDLQAYARKPFDLTLKRLTLLRSDGLLVMHPDQHDKRRKLYSLAPAVRWETTDTRKCLDFGFLKVRVSGSIGSEAVALDAAGVPWKPEVIFPVLAEPSRRRLLSALARQPKQTGDQLKGKGQRVEATLQQLAVLRKAGLVVRSENHRDRRRPLCSLAAAVPVQQHGDQVIFDFSICTVTL